MTRKLIMGFMFSFVVCNVSYKNKNKRNLYNKMTCENIFIKQKNYILYLKIKHN